MALASGIGKPVKIDFKTLKVSRGKFARVCVEIDLHKLVVGRVCVENNWLFVEYEGLHIIFTKCGCYGHYSRNCIQHKVLAIEGGSPDLNVMVVQMTSDSVVASSVPETQPINSSDPAPERDDAIPLNPHGGWLTVSRRFKPRSQMNQKEKGKVMERDLRKENGKEIARDLGKQILRNCFEGLHVEATEEGNVKKSRVHEAMQVNDARDVSPTNSKAAVGLKIKKKVVSPPLKKLGQSQVKPNKEMTTTFPHNDEKVTPIPKRTLKDMKQSNISLKHGGDLIVVLMGWNMWRK